MTTPERALFDEIDQMIRRLRPDQLRRLLADVHACGREPEPTHLATERLQ